MTDDPILARTIRAAYGMTPGCYARLCRAPGPDPEPYRALAERRRLTVVGGWMSLLAATCDSDRYDPTTRAAYVATTL